MSNPTPPRPSPRFPLKPTHLVCAALLMLCVPAHAAGIACEQARSPSETTICGDKDLLDLDAQLAKLYAQTRRRPEVPASQKQWVRKTAACGAHVACLKDAYLVRISELQVAARAVRAYRPDATDDLALAQLRQAAEQALKSNEETGLAQALDSLSFKGSETTFRNVREPGQSTGEARFPTRRPAGVTADEWQALNQSGVEAEGENGSASYTLLDMDGDGKRDLIIDSYTGGTGLWNNVATRRRQGDRFVSPVPGDSAEAGDNALYSLNGRGANQAAYWVKLQGRIYVAYFDGRYGEDRVSLLRPFEINGASPTLSVRYAYTFSIPLRQKPQGGSKEIVVSASQHSALMRGLATVVGAKAPYDGGASEKPLCPVPPGTDAEHLTDYTSFGPGHYTFEIVGDFPVWYGKECRIGQLVNWFGSYGKEGLAARIAVRKPDGSGSEESFDAIGKRRVTRIETTLSEVGKN